MGGGAYLQSGESKYPIYLLLGGRLLQLIQEALLFLLRSPFLCKLLMLLIKNEPQACAFISSVHLSPAVLQNYKLLLFFINY